MTQFKVLQRLQRQHRRSLEHMFRRAYSEGYRAGVTRARGSGRRGRTVREDATVEGLMKLIEAHFGLERYGFEVRIVHSASGRRVPAADHLRKYRREE